MLDFSSAELTRILESKIPKGHEETIIKIENSLDEIQSLAQCLPVPSSWLQIFEHFLKVGSNNIITRTFGLLIYICSKPSHSLDVQPSLLVQIMTKMADKQPNIRKNALNATNKIIEKCGSHLLFSSVFPSLPVKIRPEIIQLLMNSMKDATRKDIEKSILFILSCLADKENCPNLSASTFAGNQLFLEVLSEKIGSMEDEMKKIGQAILDQFAPKPEPKKKEEEKPVVECFVNSSSFSRKRRLDYIDVTDGIRLISEPSAYLSIKEQLDQDILDVFEEKISRKLLSVLYKDRLQGIEELKKIFVNRKNFEVTLDIVFRWCCLQFLGIQVSVAQECLTMLLDLLSTSPMIYKVELSFIVPVALWCIATKSSIYSKILTEIRHCTSSQDYGFALLHSLQLGHTVVISTIFEVLSQLDDLSTLEEELLEYSHDKCSLISESCKRLIYQIPPKNSNTVEKLKKIIQQITEAPEMVEDPNQVLFCLSAMLSINENESRRTRYLIFACQKLLSEPLLSSILDKNSLVHFMKSLIKFSLTCPNEFTDALEGLGAVFASVYLEDSFFKMIIEFIDSQNEKFNRESFVSKLFMSGSSQLLMKRHADDMSELRQFCIDVTQRTDISSDDIRKYLCKNLNGEIVTVKRFQHEDKELFKRNSLPLPHIGEISKSC